MKKNNPFLLALATIFCASVSIAHAQTFKAEDKVLNFGIGFGSNLHSGSLYTTTVPPLSVSFEYGLKVDGGPGVIGAGAFLGVAGSKYENRYGTYTYGYKYTYTIIGLRGAYHLIDMVDLLDVYGGAMAGYKVVSATATGNLPGGISDTADGSEPSFTIFVGGRYYVATNIAVMAEIGFGVPYLNLGVAFKLN
jgi:hypothetical protein